MDLDLTPDEARFQSELRSWLRAHVPKRTEGSGRREGPREELGAARVAALKDWQRRLDGAGYVAIGWPPEYGGRSGFLLEGTRPIVGLRSLANAAAFGDSDWHRERVAELSHF